jgi:hypothetical protein
MKRRDTQSVVQERTSLRDKSSHRNAQVSNRPNPSQNTINPNRGLNEDAQKQRTNQEEEEETTNAYTETSPATEKEGKNNSKQEDGKQDRNNRKDS